MKELCHCGKPLHYTSKAVEESMRKIIESKGTRFVVVEQIETGRKFNVDCHYVALHGVQGSRLDQYGFEEVT